MAHTVFAVIIGGEVVNLQVGDYYEVDTAARNIYGQQVTVVDVTRIPAGIGDVYRDGAFYRNDRTIEPLPSEAEEISRVRQEQEDMAEAIVALYEGRI